MYRNNVLFAITSAIKIKLLAHKTPSKYYDRSQIQKFMISEINHPKPMGLYVKLHSL